MERLLVKFGGKFYISKHEGANSEFLLSKLRTDKESVNILFVPTCPPVDGDDWADFDYDYVEA